MLGDARKQRVLLRVVMPIRLQDFANVNRVHDGSMTHERHGPTLAAPHIGREADAKKKAPGSRRKNGRPGQQVPLTCLPIGKDNQSPAR
jgi:hypothetical protein